MSKWLNNKKQSNNNFSELLNERVVKINLCSQITAEETKRLNKLEAVADKFKRGENIQNRQLKT